MGRDLKEKKNAVKILILLQETLLRVREGEV